MIPIFADFAIPHGMVFFWLAIGFGAYMAWNIGANDVANAMGTSVGSGSLTIKQAVIIAAVMELAGAVLVGMHVTDTVRKGIFDPAAFDPGQLVLGFLAALLAASVWLQVATFFGWPVSTTHSIVGAVVGVGTIIGGTDVIQWKKVFEIVMSWVTSPLCGGLVSYLLFLLIQRKILDQKDPLKQAYRLTPYLVFYVGFVLSMVMVFKGLKNLKLDLGFQAALLVSIGVGVIFFILATVLLKKLAVRYEKDWVALKDANPEVLERKPESDAEEWGEERRFEFERVEAIFGFLMILSACFLAFAHGANDVANAIGPVAAVVDIVQSGQVSPKAQVPIWILLLGGAGIVIGLATWGYRVIETIGKKITELTPTRGFAANIGAATTIVLASRMGFPISTTHTLIGAVLGIGLARGVGSLNFKVIRDILLSWLITIPAGAGLAILFYYILRSFFG